MSCMYLRDRSASCRRSICNLLSDQFKLVYRSKILQLLTPTDYSSLLISMQIEYEELILALSQLDDNVKSGPDVIPFYFLKRCIPSLAQPILLRFNKSLASGILPSKWKSSGIFPIFKSGVKNSVKNYRPISILSTLAKVFESIVIKRLTDFFLLTICSF